MALTPRRAKSLVLLAKLEPSYMGSTTLAAASDAMLVRDFEETWLQPAFEEQRDNYSIYDGAQGKYQSTYYGQVTFSVEAQGSGTVGTAPALGRLLKACRMTETVQAGTSVTYEKDTAVTSSLKIQYFRAGTVRTLFGCRGTFTIEFVPGKIPLFRFTFMGWCLGYTADAAVPAPTLTAFKPPLISSDTTTTTSVDAWVFPHHSVKFDLGNKIERYTPFNGTEMVIADNVATGEVKIQSTLVADKDWDSFSYNRTRFALAARHGVADGYICRVALPTAEMDGQSGVSEVSGRLAETFKCVGCVDSAGMDLQVKFL